MKEYQIRVVDELKELDTKRDKLADFIKSPANAAMNRDDMKLLQIQYAVMTEYSKVLMQRIARF